MALNRTDRLNSLLQEVLSEVIRTEVKNPHLPSLITVTSVDITKDLRHAKVFISVIGDETAKKKAIEVLNQAAGFIAMRSSKLVTMRFFPELTFFIDETVEKQARIEEILYQIHEKQKDLPKDD